MAGGSEEFQGRLLAATGGRITGWAWDPRLDDRLEVGVFVDGEHVATGTASIFRESLRLAGIGDGAHAFTIDLPAHVRDGCRHTVAAAALATGAVLPVELDFRGKSPAGDPWYLTDFLPDPDASSDGAWKSVTALSAAANDGVDGATAWSANRPIGRLEAVADGGAVGWAYDPRFPRQRLALEILIDGEVVAETIADLPRPSLVAEGIGDGRHSFLVKLPPRLRDDATHTIAARLSTGEPLPVPPYFATTTSLAPEWAETTFLDPDADISRGETGVARITVARAYAPATNGASRTLSLRRVSELLLPRRLPHEGFTSRDGPETIVLASEMVVELSDPLHFAVQPGVTDPHSERGKRFDPPRRYTVPELHVSRLPGCIVDTRSFLIMPNEHEYLMDSLRHTGALLGLGYERPDEEVVQCEIGDIPERDERVVVLGAQTNRNYSHWLVESLVRVLLFRPLDDGTYLFLTPPLADWQRQTLALVGIGAERILELEPQGPTRFREVIAVSRGMGRMPDLRPAGVAALAELASASTERRRIYCSRAGTHRRHITNEAEVAEVLLRHGFESLRPETLPISEQIDIFAGAEVVFALHGSALTNIAFSRSGTLVIELEAEGFNLGALRWNWILASLREQPFVQVVCPSADATKDLAHGHHDVTVDTRHLDAMLSRLLPG